KNFLVMLQQRRPGALRESQKLHKFLGKNVALTHGEPRFGSHFLLQCLRLWQFAKIAIGKETKLIVIVKDDAPVPSHPKIFRKQITRENIGRSKVSNRLTVIAPRNRDCLRVVFPEKKSEGTKTTLDIGVCDDDVAAVHLHNRSGVAQKLGQQLRDEPVPGNAQMLEFVRFDQSSSAIMFENQAVAPLHIFASAVFWQI